MFNLQTDDLLEQIAKLGNDKSAVHLRMLLWQVRAQLAIAQQLSIVSKHLGEIVDRSKVNE